MENVELLHSLVKNMGAMDLFGHVYEELHADQADHYRAARADGREEAFLRDLIATSKRTFNATRVFSTVVHDPTGEGMARAEGSAYALGDPTSLLMLPKIQRAARLRASEAMREYLAWLQRSHLGESDPVIAESTGRSEATIRGGRKRAIEFLVEVAHDLRHGGTTVEGELPEALERAAECYTDHRLEGARRALEGCRSALGDDPRWLNIAGLVATAEGEYDEALSHFKEGLVCADDIEMRAKLLNNWGKALHNLGDLEEAQAIYLRACRLAPDGAPPWLNLLAIASERRDLQDCRHYANQLIKLLRSGKLDDRQIGIVMNRLTNNPMYDWVRRTEAWRGPSRWLRKWSSAALLAMVFVGAFAALSPTDAPAEQAGFIEVSQGDKGEGWITPKKVTGDTPDAILLA